MHTYIHNQVKVQIHNYQRLTYALEEIEKEFLNPPTQN